MKLRDKVCIITGAGRGIGRGIALGFAREGAKVIGCDINQGWIDDPVKEIRAGGGEAAGFRVDVTDSGAVGAMVKAVKEKYGRIDVLVNNAGIVMDAQIKSMTEEQWGRVIAVNLTGTYNCTRAVVDTMIAQRAGAILNVSSIVGLYGNFGQTNYAATKFGVIGMMKSWARELGRHNVRANAICPGFIDTPILNSIPEKVLQAQVQKIPMQRMGRPEEVAKAAAFLCSDEASYVNGAVLEVSGGVTM
ncbi:MAG: 3-oxoacyl-ACP reductase FabG [Betaproteobacteria bacterium]|nr:3-oxoacyl-ACP reductase FabG [Betaproteobacteria bacterium]